MDPTQQPPEPEEEPNASLGTTAAPEPMGAGRRAGLFLLAFGSGFAVLTIEIAGARLIAPVFGLSAVPWTAVIGVILTALAVGNHVGGRLADTGRVPLSVVLAAAGLTGVLPVVGGSVPWAASSVLGFAGGAVASALILFAPPVLFLGAVVPYLVKADTESLGSVGRRAGDVSAAATAGSIVGTFTTGFVLLPLFPLPVLLGLTAAALFGMAALSGWVLGGRVPRELLGLGALGVGASGLLASQPRGGVLLDVQTLHSSVQVTQRTENGREIRELRQNGGRSSGEYVDTGEPVFRYLIASRDLLEPIMGRVESALVLGGAALTLPVALQRWAPGARVDVVELDPVVTAIAREWFTYGSEPRPGIRVFHQDARVWLRSAEGTYDLLYLDVFDHLFTVPWTMVTREALEAMSARLAPDGVLAANVLLPLDRSGAVLLGRLRATFDAVFPHVRVHPAMPDLDARVVQNLIFLAGHQAGALPDIDWPRVPAPAEGAPFTDSWAPVEALQARILVEGLGWR